VKTPAPSFDRSTEDPPPALSPLRTAWVPRTHHWLTVCERFMPQRPGGCVRSAVDETAAKPPQTCGASGLTIRRAPCTRDAPILRHGKRLRTPPAIAPHHEHRRRCGRLRTSPAPTGCETRAATMAPPAAKAGDDGAPRTKLRSTETMPFASQDRRYRGKEGRSAPKHKRHWRVDGPADCQPKPAVNCEGETESSRWPTMDGQHKGPCRPRTRCQGRARRQRGLTEEPRT